MHGAKTRTGHWAECAIVGLAVSVSLILAFVWVLAAAAVSLLPIKRQFVPGLTLLALAPVELVYLGMQHNIWVVLAAFAALLSMFRRPLGYLLRRVIARRVKRDPEP